MLDANGHVRPIQSFYRLRPPLSFLPAAFECLSLSRVRIGKQEYIGLLCVSKKRELARAIEDNNLSLVKQLTESYIRNSVAAGTCDVTCQVKRPKLSDSSQTLSTEPGDYVLELSRADMFLEKSCANRNILHASIRTPEGSPLWSEALGGMETPSCIRWNKSYEKFSFEELRWERYSEEKGNEYPLTQTETTNAILSYLLSVPALTRVVRFLLCERDLSGSTPLMLALRNQDLPAASLILGYVENMPSSADSLRQQAHLYQNAIAMPCLENQSPIQTLLFNSAIPHCEFGLKTILIQSPTVTSITPRSLLSFIQTRYPSAYRCEAYDMKGVTIKQASMVLSLPFLKQTKLNLKSLPDSDTRSIFHSSTPARFLVAFSDVWEMRDAISELNTHSITSTNQTGSPHIAFLSVQQYCGQNVFSDKWKIDVKKSYSKPSADKLDAEKQRVTLVKRLLEVLPSDHQGGQENLLSSILHNKLLIQYLQDMHGLCDPSYKFIFGNKLISEPVEPIQPSGFLGGLHSVINSQLAEPSEQDTESVPAGEVRGHSQSVLDILANIWSLVASGICQPGTGNDPCYSRRDSFVLSLIIDTPTSVIQTVLRSILDRVEMLQTSELINALRTTDVCIKLEEQDACVVTVVKKFLQSLVRLYTSIIERDKHFEFEPSHTDSDSSIPVARDRIFSVLRSFRTLAVLELFISAQALCWPLITGNLKLYPKNFVDHSTHPHYASPAGARTPSVAELCHHRRTQLLTASSRLPTLPQRGLKLPFSEPALARHSPPYPRGKRERSDYWGADDVSHIPSSSDSDDSSESEIDGADPLAAPNSDRDPDDSMYSPDELEFQPFIPSINQGMVSNQQGQYGSRRPRISWLLDGLESTMDTYQHQSGSMYGSQRTHNLNNLNSLCGGVVLARTFSRILKLAFKLLLPQADTPLAEQGTESHTDRHLDLPHLNLSAVTHSLILSHVPELLSPVFNWAGKLLDLAENQLEQGKRFKIDSRYAHTLPPGDLSFSVEDQQRTNSATPLTNTGSYLNYLLCLSAGEASAILPVIDIQSYEHVAFVLDAQLYFVANWTKCPYVSHTPHTPSPSSDSQHANSTTDNFFLRQSSLIVSKHRHQQLTEPDFKTPLKLDIPLAQKPHLLKPETSNATLFSAPTHTPTAAAPDQFTSAPSVLSYSQLEAQSLTSLCQTTSQDLANRWKHVIQAFVDVFVSTGPTSEPDNFLLARAGFSGKKARFYLLLNSPVGNTSIFNVGSVHLQIDRSQLLKDSLSKIFSLIFNTRGEIGVTFVGEAGGGSGVVAGFFTALANALKSDEQLPPKTASLLHEPGKIPEQATFYAPTPTLLTKENPLFVQRLTYYRVRTTLLI